MAALAQQAGVSYQAVLRWSGVVKALRDGPFVVTASIARAGVRRRLRCELPFQPSPGRLCALLVFVWETFMVQGRIHSSVTRDVRVV